MQAYLYLFLLSFDYSTTRGTNEQVFTLRRITKHDSHFETAVEQDGQDNNNNNNNKNSSGIFGHENMDIRNRRVEGDTGSDDTLNTPHMNKFINSEQSTTDSHHSKEPKEHDKEQQGGILPTRIPALQGKQLSTDLELRNKEQRTPRKNAGDTVSKRKKKKRRETLFGGAEYI